MGRPPKPTRIKELAGNPGKRPLNKAEPRFPVRDLACPAWLSPAARQEWQRVVPFLKQAGIITAGDRAVLMAYCQAYARWREAEEVLTQGGLTMTFETAKGGSYTQQRPEVSIAQKYYVLMLQAGSRLGFDPSSRSKLSTGGAEEGESDFAAYMRQVAEIAAQVGTSDAG